MKINIESEWVPTKDHFHYPGSIAHIDRAIKDITNILAADWLRWRSALRMLCDRLILIRSKGIFYKTSIRPSMFMR